VITAADLMDRAIVIELGPLEPARRRREHELRAEFEALWPYALGALATAAQEALARADTLPLAELPRMADFAVWAAAAMPGLGRLPEQFFDAHEANQARAHESALDASLVATVLRQFLAARENQWAGLLKDLLDELGKQAGEPLAKDKGWPKTARSLAGALKRMAPVLRAVGLTYSTSRQAGTGLTVIRFPADRP
jgi:hypothetical protein